MNFDQFKVLIEELEPISLRFRPKNDDQLGMCVRISDCFASLNDHERKVAVAFNFDKLSQKLLTLSGYIAEAAIDKGDKTILNTALMLHVIEDFRIDYRNNIQYLVLINFAAIRLNVELGLIARPLINLGSARASLQLANFLNRDQELNELQKFGVLADDSSGSFRFVSAR